MDPWARRDSCGARRGGGEGERRGGRARVGAHKRQTGTTSRVLLMRDPQSLRASQKRSYAVLVRKTRRRPRALPSSRCGVGFSPAMRNLTVLGKTQYAIHIKVAKTVLAIRCDDTLWRAKENGRDRRHFSQSAEVYLSAGINGFGSILRGGPSSISSPSYSAQTESSNCCRAVFFSGNRWFTCTRCDNWGKRSFAPRKPVFLENFESILVTTRSSTGCVLKANAL
jgi:hypothetical protein